MPNFFRWAVSYGKWPSFAPNLADSGGASSFAKASEDMSKGDRVAVGGAWVTATEGSAQAGEAADRRRENSMSSP